MQEITYYRLKYEDWRGRMYQKEFEGYDDVIEWLLGTEGFSHPSLYKVTLILDHEVSTQLKKEDLTSAPDIMFKITGCGLEERTGLTRYEIIRQIRMMSGIKYDN